MLLGVAVQILKFEAGQTFKSTIPNISFVCVQRRLAQQCWINLCDSSNIFKAMYMYYTWCTVSYGCSNSDGNKHLKESTLLNNTALQDDRIKFIWSCSEHTMEASLLVYYIIYHLHLVISFTIPYS